MIHSEVQSLAAREMETSPFPEVEHAWSWMKDFSLGLLLNSDGPGEKLTDFTGII
jgi:hypothetical protein